MYSCSFCIINEYNYVWLAYHHSLHRDSLWSILPLALSELPGLMLPRSWRKNLANVLHSKNSFFPGGNYVAMILPWVWLFRYVYVRICYSNFRCTHRVRWRRRQTFLHFRAHISHKQGLPSTLKVSYDS